MVWVAAEELEYLFHHLVSAPEGDLILHQQRGQLGNFTFAAQA